MAPLLCPLFSRLCYLKGELCCHYAPLRLYATSQNAILHSVTLATKQEFAQNTRTIAGWRLCHTYLSSVSLSPLFVEMRVLTCYTYWYVFC